MIKEACIYHRGDLDGYSSGAIVRAASPDPDIVMVPMEYGDPIPWELLMDRDCVYVVDFNLAPLSKEMIALQNAVPRLVWIDHHKSAIDEAEKIDFNPPGLRRVGQAACELCWEYFFGGSTKLPHAIWLLGRYDVWDRGASPEIDPFQAGMQAQAHTNPIDPESNDFWNLAFLSSEKFLSDRLREGELILQYQQGLYKRYQENAHEVFFYDKVWVALNVQKVGSQAFEGIYDPEKHHGCISYFRTSHGWVVSLYSLDDREDFSKIAKSYGGGGHPSACGFTVKSTSYDALPFTSPIL